MGYPGSMTRSRALAPPAPLVCGGEHASAAPASTPTIPWRAVVPLIALAGLLSGLRLLFTYRMLGVRISLGDALGSGWMEWGLWLPFVPLTAWLARRVAPGCGRLRLVAVHVAAGLCVSMAHLTAFSALSGLVRLARFGDAFRLDLHSPIYSMLAPGVVIYGLFIVGWWWREARASTSVSVPPVIPEAPLREAAQQDAEQLPFRTGRKQLWLQPDEIEWVRAAGAVFVSSLTNTTKPLAFATTTTTTTTITGIFCWYR